MPYRDGALRCWERDCLNIVVAGTYGTALRLAADRGWWRGEYYRRRADFCPEHHPRRRDDDGQRRTTGDQADATGQGPAPRHQGDQGHTGGDSWRHPFGR